jgi:hypothetical protein
MREESAHARNQDLSAVAEIFANDSCYPNKLRISQTWEIAFCSFGQQHNATRVEVGKCYFLVLCSENHLVMAIILSKTFGEKISIHGALFCK